MHIRLILFAVVLSACTENSRARNFGGSGTIAVPCGQKVVNATWKETNLWYLTRPMREGEVPETYSFSESSQFGVLEGAMTIKECHR